MVRLRDGRAIFSDCAFKYPNLEENHPLGLSLSLEDCQVACDRIRREADIFIPGFDPYVLSRYPDGAIG